MSWKNLAIALMLANVSGIGMEMPAFAAEKIQQRVPLPLDVVAGATSLNRRALISRDGRWVALTYERPGEARDATQSKAFTDSGAMFEGHGRTGIRLVDTKSGETVELASNLARSWGANWDPQGRRLAYYSDAGGEVGIWLWNSERRESRRIGSAIARPTGRHDRLQWSADGRLLLSKLLPEGTTIAEMNRLTAKGYEPEFRAAEGEAFARVLSTASNARVARSGALADQENMARRILLADLGIIDTATGNVRRIIRNAYLSGYRFSPDSRQVAFAQHLGWFPATQMPASSLSIYSLEGGSVDRLIDQVGLGYGYEFSWAPDSSRIAFVAMDPASQTNEPLRQLRLLSLDGSISGAEGNIGAAAEDAEPPYWTDDRTVYAEGGGSLWRLDTPSKTIAAVKAPDNVEVTNFIPEQESGFIDARRRPLHLLGRERGTERNVLLALDPSDHKLRRLHSFGDEQVPGGALSVSGTGRLAYYSASASRNGEPFLLDMGKGQVRELTRFNEALYRFPQGETRLIEFVSSRGEPLKGALMLPPGYKRGERLPTIFWVYGGTTNEEVEDALDGYSLGFGWRPIFNFNVLTSRGYAVFMPAIPLRVGETLADIRAAVLPSLDALVEQGYSDPDRFAVMGASYGSYTSLSLITGTDRFKAAVISAAGMGPNLFSSYAYMNPDGSDVVGFFEEGQGRMGGTPWEHPDRYFRNSPFFSLDKMSTPLLIGQGYDDGRIYNLDALFASLRRLGKPVEYRLYAGEGHSLTGRSSVIDFWKAQLELFERYLGTGTSSSAATSLNQP